MVAHEYFVFFPGNNYLFKLDTSSVKKGLIIGRVTARDRDQGVNGIVRYFLKNPGNKQTVNKANEHFKVDDITGDIVIKKAPFNNRKYILYVGASDQARNVGQRRTSMAIVEIRLEGSLDDQLENNPKVQVVKPIQQINKGPLLQETQPSQPQLQRVKTFFGFA